MVGLINKWKEEKKEEADGLSAKINKGKAYWLLSTWVIFTGLGAKSLKLGELILIKTLFNKYLLGGFQGSQRNCEKREEEEEKVLEVDPAINRKMR